MSIESPVPPRIEVGDDVIPDAEFCTVALGGISRRTARRYEADGLPYAIIGGKKFRPLNAGRKWLASRITVRRPQRRRA